MVLESTMFCLDNSEWMRNGDYLPTRLAAQQDAASMLCNDRLRNNPENTVGLLTMAGKGVSMLVSPTEDTGKVLACFAGVSIGGKADFATSIQIAQLALKHRKNKNGGQRIIVFVGSPVLEEIPSLQKMGKLLKKNSVSVDIVMLGDFPENNEKLTEFINAANGADDNCRLVVVPPGVLPSDALNASPIMMQSNNFGGGMAGGDFGDFDAENDPELAMALRVSQEEARFREEARAREAAQSMGSVPAAAPVASSAAVPAAALSFGGDVALDEEDEEMLMQRALALSMQDVSESANQSASVEEAATASRQDVDEEHDDDLEEALRASMQMSESVQQQQPLPPIGGGGVAAMPPRPPEGGFVDPDFVNQLLNSVDVDMNDPRIQEVLAQLGVGAAAPQENDGDNTKDSKKRKGDDV